MPTVLTFTQTGKRVEMAGVEPASIRCSLDESTSLVTICKIHPERIVTNLRMKFDPDLIVCVRINPQTVDIFRRRCKARCQNFTDGSRHYCVIGLNCVCSYFLSKRLTSVMLNDGLHPQLRSVCRNQASPYVVVRSTISTFVGMSKRRSTVCSSLQQYRFGARRSLEIHILEFR